MNQHKPHQRLLAMGLALVMALGTTPISVSAYAATENGGEIIVFEALSGETANRQVSLGTSLEELDLPVMLNATVRVATATDEDEPVQDSGEPEQAQAPDEQEETDVPDGAANVATDEPDGDSVSGNNAPLVTDDEEAAGDEQQTGTPSDAQGTAAGDEDGSLRIQTSTGSAIALGDSDTGLEYEENTQSDYMDMDIPVPVEWVSTPDYDGETAGIYTFTAEITGFTVSADLPAITVTVGTPAGVVTAFDALETDIRWQSVEHGTAQSALNLPTALFGTIEGEAAEVPVTWEAEPAYDENTKGMYIFTAKLAEGFSATAELPHITVVVRAGQPQNRMFARSFGGGAQDTDPFLIGTAAQLADIAALTNNGNLETMFLGTTSGTVYLKMDNDIDLSGIDPNDNGSGWVPIGSETEPFKGSFDGNHKIISGLYINRTGGFSGVFGRITEATIKNLGLTDVNVQGGNWSGGIAALALKGTSIENCFVTGLVSGGQFVGGIAGFANGVQLEDKVSIENCYSNLIVTSTDELGMSGGIVGTILHGSINNCYTTGSIAGFQDAGGISGRVGSGSTIRNCAALNEKIMAPDGIGRIGASSDYTEADAFSNNIAFSGMTVLENGSAKTITDSATGADGASKSAVDITAENFFQGVFGSDAAWTYETGKLPILTGLAGQDATMPAHIVDGGTSIYFPGAGTEANPYQISTPEQLAKLAELVNAGNADYNSKHYKLTADIDLSGIDPNDDGSGWVPIGRFTSSTDNATFKGSFNGGNHVITGLTINRENADHQGLFGYIIQGSVQNLGVVDANIIGKSYVGGIVGNAECGMIQGCYVSGIIRGHSQVGGVLGNYAGGSNSHKIQNCYSTASVSASNNMVGGIVGNATNVVENCYATGSVVGNAFVGGVAGYVYGTVQNCAALNPEVSGTSSVGRVTGYFQGGTLQNNYAFSGMTVTVGGSEQAINDGALDNKNGLAKSAADLFTGTDFWTTAGNWNTEDGATAWSTSDWQFTTGGLPILVGLAGQSAALPDHLLAAGTIPFEGSGTSDSDPYRIKTAADLAKLAELVSGDISFLGKFLRLENDLDLSSYASGEGWTPIGKNYNYSFKGNFDGGGHKITGLTINRDVDYQGLFGYISGGTVENLGVVGASVTGEGSVGGVAGGVYSGTVQNCSVTGAVSGTGNIGGVAGYVTGTVQNCHSTGTVSGTGNYVGGVIGSGAYNVIIKNCYSTGEVSGTSFVGGVVGFLTQGNEGYNPKLINCYSTGTVSSTGNYVGGVAGYVLGSTVQNCAALNPSVSGTSYVGRVAGYVYSSTVQNNYAYKGMACTSAGSSYNNGGEMTSATLFGGSFWTTEGNWDNAAWDANTWDFADGKLPILKGTDGAVLPGQSGSPGLYLLNLSTDELTVTLSGADVSGSGNSYTALASYTAQPVSVAITGMENWTDPDIIVKWQQGTDTNTLAAISMTDGSGTFSIPAQFSGSITVTAASVSNLNNKTSVTLMVNKRDLTATDFSSAIPTDHVYNGLARGIGTVSLPTGSSQMTVKYNDSSTAPTNAGTYAVALSYGGDVVYNATAAGIPIGDYTISPKTIIINGVTATPREYDDTPNVALSGGTLEGVESGDTSKVNFALGNGTIADENAGTDKAVTTDITLTGEAAGNYTLTQPTVTVTINKKALTLTTATVENKEYDGTTDATVTGVVFEGLVEDEILTLGTDYTATGTFNNASVGTGKTVTVTPTLNSTDKANNYGVSGTVGATANITAKPIDGTVTINVTQGSGDANKIDAGDTLTADISGITPSGATLFYQWYRDGSPIGSATGNTYTIAARATDPAGSLITVKVTGTGNYTGEKTSEAVEIGKIPLDGSISIDGATAVGATLTLNTGSLTPSGATTAITWLRDGNAISGATGGTYTITRDDLGKRISVSVTGTGEYSGTKTAEITIPAVAPEAPANLRASAGNGQVTLNWQAPFDGGSALTKYQLSSDNGASWTDISVVTTYAVTGLTNGTQYTFKLRAVNSVGTGGDTSVTATPVRPYSGGGSSSGGSSGSTTTPATTTPAKTPNQPVTAAAPVTATLGQNGAASASIPEKSVTDAIAKAQADAKAQGKTTNGISVAMNVTMPKGATALTVTLPRKALDSLVSAGVTSLELNGSPVKVTFDKKALAEIQKQSSGNISITIAPKTGLSASAKQIIGTRPVYNITVGYGSGKTVTSFGGGMATVSVPYTPAKGEAVGGLYAVYVDAKGNATRIAGSAYDANSGCVMFTTTHFSLYGIGYTAPSAKFADITSHWAKESIDYAVGRGLLSGTTETTFAPDTTMTRGMLVTALGRLANVDTKAYTTGSFTDVKADSAFRPYIEWAYKKGIIQGIGNSQFAPDRAITREEIAVIFSNYAKATGYTLPVTRTATTYADASSIGSTYKTAVTAMQQAGIMMGGTSNKFNPKSSATRVEVSSMLHRYIKLTIDPDTAQGWAKNDAGQYLYYKNGKAFTGTQTIDGTKYFFNTSGTLKTGWVKNGNSWTFYSGNTMLVGFWKVEANDNNKTYYFNKDGIMAAGKWLEIEGKWYYFNADGSLARNTKIDDYEVAANGVRKTK